MNCDLCGTADRVLRVEVRQSDDARPVLSVALCTDCRFPLISAASDIARRILAGIR